MCLEKILQKYFNIKKISEESPFEDTQNDISSPLNSLLSNDSSSIISIAKPMEPQIIIIGAGAAGLACATKLLEFGLNNFLILEAENRIGGRIHTQMFADNIVDLGAQWVHGELRNIVYDMVQAHDCLESTGKIYESYQSIRSNGQVVPEQILDRLKSIFKDILENCTEELRHFEGSLGDYLKQRFNAALLRNEMQAEDLILAEEFFENFVKIESSETAAGMDEVSARGFLEYHICPGDYLLNWKDKGYITFLHMLMSSNEEQLFDVLSEHIRFENKVKLLEWNTPHNKVIVKCEAKSQHYEADHVVLTVSLGVLKENIDTMFQPHLPLHKKQTIIGLGYGNVAKIYLEFAYKFWPDNWHGFTTLWLKEDLEELHKSDLNWLEDIFGFYCVNYQPHVLLAWMVGLHVEQVEKMSSDEVKSGCMHLLRRFLHFWEIPDILNVQVSQWKTNPNFHGAYSFRSMLSEELKATALQLSQPITVPASINLANSQSVSSVSTETTETVGVYSSNIKPVLLFAGEATSMHHYSTVHGAVESGYREANRLIAYYGIKQRTTAG